MNKNIIAEYPFTKQSIVYLDSAATAQKPQHVIDTITTFLTQKNATVHRSIYPLSITATKEFENVRNKIKSFLNISDEYEVICTSGTTQSLNLLAESIQITDSTKNEIVLTELEHHANLVCWIELAKKRDWKIKYIPILKVGTQIELDMDKAKELITEKTAIVSITQLSNVVGSVVDVKQICKFANSVNAISIVDGAQSVTHMPISITDIHPDFFVFSGHKIGALTGCGSLIGKRESLLKLKPYQKGGNMISSVTKDSVTYNNLPYMFEAGTPPIIEFISLGSAVDFYMEHKNEIFDNQSELTSFCLMELQKIPGLSVYTCQNQKGIISFIHKTHSIYDIATLLGEKKICIRAGHHCCMPLMNELGISGTARVSIGAHVTKEDVITFIEELQNIVALLE